MTTVLIPASDLPLGFMYPAQFNRIIELGLTNLEPWKIMSGSYLIERLRGLQKRYPEQRYVPFARRTDNDDLACWEPTVNSRSVLIVHDFASAGWERNEQYADFDAWLRQAIEDLIEFGS
jgi:hypothetical protein